MSLIGNESLCVTTTSVPQLTIFVLERCQRLIDGISYGHLRIGLASFPDSSLCAMHVMTFEPLFYMGSKVITHNNPSTWGRAWARGYTWDNSLAMRKHP